MKWGKIFSGGGLGAALGALSGIALAPFTGGLSLGLVAGMGALGAATGGLQGAQMQQQEDLAKEAQDKQMAAALAQTPEYRPQEQFQTAMRNRRKGIASTILSRNKASGSSGGKSTTA